MIQIDLVELTRQCRAGDNEFQCNNHKQEINYCWLSWEEYDNIPCMYLNRNETIQIWDRKTTKGTKKLVTYYKCHREVK